MKAMLAVIVALLLSLSLATVGFAAEVKGTITKIDGHKITVKDDKGKESTVEAKEMKDVKVGDKVSIKDGKVTKQAKPAAGGY